VRSIFINIFGGVTRCDEVARGILEGMERVKLTVPVVVRLDGTNSAEGRSIIDERVNAQLIRKNTMLEAAQTAVALAKGN